MLNDMYLLANQWLKTTGPSQSGLARTFAIKLDMLEPLKKKEIDPDMKLHGVEKPKRDKDLSQVKCFRCHQFGHYASKCPHKEERTEEDQTYLCGVGWH
jgi:hypothetical protein